MNGKSIVVANELDDRRVGNLVKPLAYGLSRAKTEQQTPCDDRRTATAEQRHFSFHAACLPSSPSRRRRCRHRARGTREVIAEEIRRENGPCTVAIGSAARPTD